MLGQPLRRLTAVDRVRQLREQEQRAERFQVALRPVTREEVLAERTDAYWDLVKYMQAKQWPAKKGA